MIFYKKNRNLPGSMFLFYLESQSNFYNNFYVFTNQRENKIRVPGVYINEHYPNVIVKMTSNSKHTVDRKHRKYRKLKH